MAQPGQGYRPRHEASRNRIASAGEQRLAVGPNFPDRHVK
jgi:hypothetical protein